jgi:hypothetical protein
MSEERLTVERLRRELTGVAEVAGDGRACPPSERIALSGRGELPPTEDEAVILHLASCTSCAAAWRVARDIAGDVEPSALPGERRRFPFRWVGLAAAATLVLAVGVGALLLKLEREAPPTYRTTEALVVANEVGEQTPLPRERCLLRWTAGPPGTHYDLRIMTAALQPMLKREGIDQAEFLVPQEVLGDVASGERILWHVTARLPDGRLIESDTFVAVID